MLKIKCYIKYKKELIFYLISTLRYLFKNFETNIYLKINGTISNKTEILRFN